MINCKPVSVSHRCLSDEGSNTYCSLFQRVNGEQQEKKKRTPVPRGTPTTPVSKSDESLFFIEF